MIISRRLRNFFLNKTQNQKVKKSLRGLLVLTIFFVFAFIVAQAAAGPAALESPSRSLLLYTGENDEVTSSLLLPKKVTLKVDGTTIVGVTLQNTLSEFITEQDIPLNEHDEIYPSSDFRLIQDTYAEIVRVEKSTYTVQEKVPFETKEVEDDTIEYGSEVVSQQGVTGLVEKTYEKTYKNGQITSEKLIAEKVLQQPQDQIVKTGTKIVPKTAVIDGKTITYYYKIWAWATSYDSSCYGCNEWTATGAKLKYGIIAADPKVIPWHTKVYVAGGPGYKAYGFGQMEDTGGSLKSATKKGYVHIDLGFEDVSKGWWAARYTWVYLLVE